MNSWLTVLHIFKGCTVLDLVAAKVFVVRIEVGINLELLIYRLYNHRFLTGTAVLLIPLLQLLEQLFVSTSSTTI